VEQTLPPSNYGRRSINALSLGSHSEKAYPDHLQHNANGCACFPRNCSSTALDVINSARQITLHYENCQV
jgi:hypothetical protein